MPASSVGHVPLGTRPPCVLGLLGFRRPCTNGLTDVTARNKELAYLVAVSGLTIVGFASVYIARRALISWGSMGYAGFFIGLYLTAHLISRRTVPNADPYLLPMAGFLTAIGLTEIYRPGPSDAFKQGLWIVVGLVLFAVALIVLRREYPVLESSNDLLGPGAIGLLFLPRLPWAG